MTSPALRRAPASCSSAIKDTDFDPKPTVSWLARLHFWILFPGRSALTAAAASSSPYRPAETPERLDGPKTRTHPVSEGEQIQALISDEVQSRGLVA